MIFLNLFYIPGTNNYPFCSVDRLFSQLIVYVLPKDSPRNYNAMFMYKGDIKFMFIFVI